jgi:hypothetical protein
MSGQIIPTPAYKASDWQNFGIQVEKQRLGFIALSLTNYDNDSEPQIAASSVVEISGSLFKFDSNDSIGGTPTSGQINYIMLEVSGSGDSQTVSGSWTTTAPTWNDAKQGWYDVTGNKRYVGGCYYDGTNYKLKFINHHRDFGIYERYHSISLVGYTSANWTYRGYDISMNGGGSGYLPVNLPHRAIVTAFLTHVLTFDANFLYTQLTRSPLTSAGTLVLAQNNHESAGTLEDTSIDEPVIDNENYKYYAYINLVSYLSNTVLQGIRIKYLFKD